MSEAVACDVGGERGGVAASEPSGGCVHREGEGVSR
jgi:hypothetical protein